MSELNASTNEPTNDLAAQIARTRERLAGDVEALVRKGQILGRTKARCEAALALATTWAAPALVAVLVLGLTSFAVMLARRPNRESRVHPPEPPVEAAARDWRG